MASKSLGLLSLALLALVHSSQGQSTVYEYFSGDGITSGLTDEGGVFYLNGKPLTINSGTIHYFRVHPDQWRDRLKKARAAGLIAVETYVPWNLHEPQRDVYDFGDGGNDMSAFLDLVTFIKTAQEEDLLVIFRPGPYICAEWEFGGLPSWLLRDSDMQVRKYYDGYTSRVSAYYNQLLPLVTDLQFTKGGPIIMFQIENEYGSFDGGQDKDYLSLLRQLMLDNGIDGFFFTSDPMSNSNNGALDGVLITANFQNNPENELNRLHEIQPDRPMMVAEYWTGWFAHWMDGNLPYVSDQQIADDLDTILNMGSSFNFYMFIGGTSFGFMNGANIGGWPYYSADTSSYDYDAPLTEAGDYSEKFYLVKDVIANHNQLDIVNPELPPESSKMDYGTVNLEEYIPYNDLLNLIPSEDRVQSDTVLAMEYLDINNGNGQSYGYTLYRTRTTINDGSVLKIWGRVRDIAIVLVDGERRTPIFSSYDDIGGFGYYAEADQEFTLSESNPGEKTLDILVENWGRNNFGGSNDMNYQRKGLSEGQVELDGVQLGNWEISALQLRSSWVNSLSGWQPYDGSSTDGPGLWRGVLTISGTPQDTFLETPDWRKGVVFVNGFNLGRYFHLGPQKTLYVPAPVLQEGDNQIVIFEQYSSGSTVNLLAAPVRK